MVGRLDAHTLLTARLRLRPWTEADDELLAELAGLAEVVRYVGDGALWSAARVAEASARVHGHWEAHGFGWRVAIERGGDRAVGLIALNYAGEGTPGLAADEFEIGWWLHPDVWGRGYASEGARAVRDEALRGLRAPSIVARIQPANAASRRVAEGLGMALERETVGRFGEAVLVYRLSPRLPAITEGCPER